MASLKIELGKAQSYNPNNPNNPNKPSINHPNNFSRGHQNSHRDNQNNPNNPNNPRKRKNRDTQVQSPIRDRRIRPNISEGSEKMKIPKTENFTSPNSSGNPNNARLRGYNGNNPKSSPGNPNNPKSLPILNVKGLKLASMYEHIGPGPMIFETETPENELNLGDRGNINGALVCHTCGERVLKADMIGHLKTHSDVFLAYRSRMNQN